MPRRTNPSPTPAELAALAWQTFDADADGDADADDAALFAEYEDDTPDYVQDARSGAVGRIVGATDDGALVVEWAGGAVGAQARDVYSPQCDEPLMIKGVRTTLQFSEIHINIEGEAPWTTAGTPIWGIAGQAGVAHDNFRWFQRPVFLPAKAQLVMSLINTLDNTLTDGTGGTITWLCETM